MANNSDSGTEDTMFGPLLFENDIYERLFHETQLEVPCLLCDNIFNLRLSFHIYVNHLFKVHHVVIEEIQEVKNLPKYIRHWKNKFKTIPIEEIVPAVRIDSSSQCYFFLSTLLKEDKEVRHKLKLDHALKVQEFERTDTGYTKPCIFCKLNFEGTRPEFVVHLETQHNFQLGNPQNLVYIEELVDKISEKVDTLTCVYCNKIFPDRAILKEHMRKKLHKRLNWRDKEYDKFFIINYLELDKSRTIFKQRDGVSQDEETNNDEDYNDWNDKEDLVTCLFCDKRENNINTLCLHMDGDHDFDFADLTKNFDFYQKVKFVNYVRRQMHRKKCFYCDLLCNGTAALREHLLEEGHCQIPELKRFDQPEFYFPTYEDDAFLYLIDDVED